MGAPSPPPAPPPAAASSPVTGASSAHVCETSPAGPGERDRPRRRDGNTAAPALRRRRAERGDRAGKEGARGEAGQGQARGPARQARALGPRGRRRCYHRDAPRPGCPPASPSPPDSPRPGLQPASSSTSPLGFPQPLCCRQLQIPKCVKRSLAEPLHSEHALGTPGCQRASEAGGRPSPPGPPGFHPPGVSHSPVHYSLPHPLLHPGRDPFLRPRKRKLRVGGEGRVGVGKSAGKEGGGREKFRSV